MRHELSLLLPITIMVGAQVMMSFVVVTTVVVMRVVMTIMMTMMVT